jgi:serine/threonine protein kinase
MCRKLKTATIQLTTALLPVEDLRLEKTKPNKLGKGGFGTVYRGMYLTEPVTIKVIDFGGDNLPADAQSMFWKEVQLHYSIRHLNVVTVLGAAVRHDDAGGR